MAVMSSSQKTEAFPGDSQASKKGLATLWGRCRKALRLSSTKLKVEEVLGKALKEETVLQSLQAIVELLVRNKLADFACLSLVSQRHDTFGIVAACGAGSSCFPPLIVDAAELSCSTRPSVLVTSSSNWSVQDAVETRLPLYYDCSDKHADLPHEATWLKQSGVQAMFSLPCVHDGAVHGVLTIGVLQSANPLLMYKLQELAQQMTPLVLDGKHTVDYTVSPSYSPAPSIPATQHCELLDAIAAAAIDELVHLDLILLKNLDQAQPAMEEMQVEIVEVETEPCAPRRSFSAPVVPLAHSISDMADRLRCLFVPSPMSPFTPAANSPPPQQQQEEEEATTASCERSQEERLSQEVAAGNMAIALANTTHDSASSAELNSYSLDRCHPFTTVSSDHHSAGSKCEKSAFSHKSSCGSRLGTFHAINMHMQQWQMPLS